MGICMLWASFTLGAESSGTSESLCMLWEEDCRTAGLGKTERPVGWEGNGEPARRPLLRHCTRGNPQKQLGASTVTEPFLYPRWNFGLSQGCNASTSGVRGNCVENGIDDQ